MRYIVFCDDSFFYQVLKSHREAGSAWLFVVQEPELADWLEKKKIPVIRGPFSSQSTYQRAKIGREDRVIIALSKTKLFSPILRLLSKEGVRPSLLLSRNKEVVDLGSPDLKVVSCTDLLSSPLFWELRAISLREKTREIHRILGEAERVLILVQDDPDPDAIASALALRTLLGRNKLTAPIASFGVVDRPENMAMLKHLEIEVDRIDAKRLSGYDRICFVDTQPSRFPVKFPRIDVVVDHHPEEKGYHAAYREIRSNQGATSTVMTEYLRAEDVKISHRLATALLYGIGTDTAFLERGTHPGDVEAFSFLYPLANHGLIRQIERPEFPQEEAGFVQKAIRRWRIEHRLLVSHLGQVPRQDIVPRLADFFTQVEGIDWSVLSGIVGGNLIISARNMGKSGNAGSLMKEAFGSYGRAGGHRFMAKAVMPLKGFREVFGRADERFVRDLIFERLVDLLQREAVAV